MLPVAPLPAACLMSCICTICSSARACTHARTHTHATLCTLLCSIRAAPERMGMRPVSASTSVDLPEPLCPMRATDVPAGISMFTFSTAAAGVVGGWCAC